MARISVHIKPGASRNALSVDQEQKVTATVTSRPVEGEANEHLIKLLSKVLRCPKSSLRLISGQKSRHKIIEIETMSEESALESIQNASGIR